MAEPEKVTTPRGVLLSMSYFTNREAAALALASVKTYTIGCSYILTFLKVFHIGITKINDFDSSFQGYLSTSLLFHGFVVSWFHSLHLWTVRC